MHVRWIAFPALVSLVLLAPASLGMVPRTETKSYVGTTIVTPSLGTLDFAAVVLCDPFSNGVGFGGACFRLDGTERVYQLTVRDAVGLQVPVWIAYFDAFGDLIFGFPECLDSGVPQGFFVIPPGAVSFTVGITDVAVCLGGPGTFGTITVAYQ